MILNFLDSIILCGIVDDTYMAVDSVFYYHHPGRAFRVGFFKTDYPLHTVETHHVQDLIPDFLQTFLPVPSTSACSSLVALHKISASISRSKLIAKVLILPSQQFFRSFSALIIDCVDTAVACTRLFQAKHYKL
jgi:hypothetical protein